MVSVCFLEQSLNGGKVLSFVQGSIFIRIGLFGFARPHDSNEFRCV